MFRVFRSLLAFCLVAMALAPSPLLACATCFGSSDSDLARGMNWGILSLLVVVVGVLGGIATFFVYLARRSAELSALPREITVAETPNDVS